MTESLKQACDAVLSRVVAGQPRLPGVVAMVTDRAGTLYAGAAGERILGSGVPMTTDTVFAMYSATKAIAATAVLQLAEAGRLDLDAPAKAYVPELGQLEVLEGFDADGKPVLRAPKRDITTRMLLLHTAGFANDVFNETYLRLRQSLGLPSTGTARKASLMMPLLFDPGDRWEYGSGVDWAGQVVEAIAGKRLGEVMQERIFAPLGMTSTAFTLTPSMRERLARVHQRGADASLEPLMNFGPTANPEVDMGGSGLYGTVEDYIRFIRMWLNHGMGDHGRVLKPETVAMAVQNGLGDKKIKALPGVIPSLSNNAEFFPGMSKSWALSFMLNDEAAPTGRPAGTLAWAGLANCYFWIDHTTQVGGFWATQIFPFVDATAIGGYLDFETVVYEVVSR
ncbi:serine hydrolase [Paraburkholderia sp. RL18-103-BIB-C]|uniref:serine hydrolase domain-containing protein n=1 Tax=unclassified Paraburkholderia TaxID=2615204 RepID=UPI0038B9B9F8